jgi:hypothetical protein
MNMLEVYISYPTVISFKSLDCLSKIEAQCWNLGHVEVVPRQRKPTVGEDTRLNVLLTIQENPVTTARQLSRENDISLRYQLLS